jgi:phosphatidylglycerol:prolipoprotein diacylglycerol transferase
MVPYFIIPSLTVGGVRIRFLVIAIIAGAMAVHYRFLRRLRRKGLDPALGARMSLTITVSSLAGAHLFDAVYEPRLFFSHWQSFLDLWNGISALGGVIGFILGWVLFWLTSSLTFAAALAMFDAAVYCVALGCAVMRMGCFAVHDHIGTLSSHWLAVRFPDGARWDLGLLEVLLWLAMAGLFRWLDRTPRRPGFYPALYLILYSAFRLAVDPLRFDQTYYHGLSVDAWVVMAALPTGLWFAWKSATAPQP